MAKIGDITAKTFNEYKIKKGTTRLNKFKNVAELKRFIKGKIRMIKGETIQDLYKRIVKLKLDEIKNEKIRKLNIKEYNKYIKQEQKDFFNLVDIIENDENNKEKEYLRKLRKIRVVKKNYFVQRTGANYNTVIDAYDSDILRYFNNNIGKMIYNLYNDTKDKYTSIKLNIFIGYINLIGVQGIENDNFNIFSQDRETINIIRNFNFSYMKLLNINFDNYNNITFESQKYKKTIKTNDINFNANFIQKELNEIAKLQFYDAPNTYYFDFFNGLFTKKAKVSELDIIKSLKAFSPISNKVFHEATICSTTTGRNCIYETYYYLYRDNTKSLLRNKDIILSELKKENIKIQKYVKNGELYNFLIAKSKELNEIMYVEYFKSSQLGFKVYPCGKTELIEEISDLVGKKTFLYDNQHVAPRRQITSIDLKELKLSMHVKKIIEEGNNKMRKLKEDFIKENKKDKETFNELKNICRDKYLILKKEANNICKSYFGKAFTEFKDEINLSKNEQFFIKPEKIKEVKNNRIVYGYDFETYTNEKGECVPFCLCLYTLQNKNNKKEEIVFYNKDPKIIISDFIKYLNEIRTVKNISKTNKKTKVQDILIYGFNNSRFDNLLIISALLKEDPSCKYTIHKGAIKSITYSNIKFLDISCFYTGSLKTVAGAFRLESKGVFPYRFPNKDNLDYKGNVPELKYWNNENDRNECINEVGNEFNLKEYCVKYCMLDSKLVHDIALIHIKESSGEINNRKFDCAKCTTGAGLALKIFKQAFLERELYESNNAMQELERLAYKGGRTEVFKKKFLYNKDKGNYLKYFDINSSYPASMTKTMPVKYILSQSYEEEIILTKENITDYNLYLAKSEYIGNNPNVIPNLLIRSDKGDIIALKNTDYAYHWGVELKEAIDNDFKITIKEEHYYEGDTIFMNYAEYLYNERLKIKKSSPCKAMFYKLLLNSLYGKFGQKENINNALILDDTQAYRYHNDPNIKVEGFDAIDDDSYILKYKRIDDKCHSIGNLIRFSSYIAALSRTNLAIMMRRVGHEHVYYCDTDSVFIDVEAPKDLIDQNILGMWKQEEYEYDYMDENGNKVEKKVLCDIYEAIFLAPKSYIYKVNHNDKNIKKDELTCMKAKGQRQDDLMKKMDELLKENKDVYSECLDGNTIVIKNPNMFIRNINSVVIKEQDRSMSTVYNKRIFNNDNNNSESFAYNTYQEWYDNKYIKIK